MMNAEQFFERVAVERSGRSVLVAPQQFWALQQELAARVDYVAQEIVTWNADPPHERAGVESMFITDNNGAYLLISDPRPDAADIHYVVAAVPQ